MGNVTIPKTEYDQLIEDQLILQALYVGGVDNWEWYDESLKALQEDEDS